MKNILPTLCLLCIAHGMMAQPVKQGQWETRLYPGGIVKLQWSYKDMPRPEAVGDAVILQPVDESDAGSVPALQQQAGGHSWQLQLHHGQKVTGIQAFDSGHVRGIRLDMPPQSIWLGGGERSLPLVRNGQRITLYNAPHYGYSENQDELNYSVPFVMTTAGYGLLFDNPAKGYIDFGKATPGVLETAFISGALHLYIIPGHTPEHVLANYSMLTGRQPLPPRWALGNLMSRFGYRSQQQVQQIATQMRKSGFAFDGVIIDVFWFGDSIQYGLGNLDWINKTRWPNPSAMIDGWKKQGVQTILVTEPFVLQNTRQFAASQPYLAADSSGKPHMLTDFYFGYGGMLDLFQPQARQWFWQHYRKQNDIGVGGWWGDLGEPEKHPQAIVHNLQSFGVQRPMAADEVHNMYGHMWSKMMYENWRKDYPNKRLFFLNRAGYAGSQRYSIFPWTGDISRSWSGLRAQLPLLQSMSLSGVPYIHSDAGGFTMVDEDDPELYIRWLQFAGFTPVFRPHGTAVGDDLKPANVVDVPSEPALKPEPYRSMARQVVNLRYQLLPYIYTLAFEQTRYGKPLIRPMVFEGAKDTNLIKATDQYLFGSAFLVAPVLEKGASTRRLYLPEGQWYRLENNTVVPGKQWMDETVSLTQMPVFVKAGAFVPHWDTTLYTNTSRYKPTQPLRIRYYPSMQASAGQYYDDDGQTPDAQTDSSQHQLVQLLGKCTESGLEINLLAANWPKGLKRTLLLELPLTPDNQILLTTPRTARQWTANGKPVKPLPKPTYWQNTRWLTLPVVFDGQAVQLRASW